MKIIFLSNSTIPSRFANSVQVMNMCAGFASKGHSVTLFAIAGSKRRPPLTDTLHAEYGLPVTFQVRLISPLLPFRYPLLGTFAAIRMVLRLAPEKVDLIYGRNLIAMWLATYFDTPLIFEAHSLPKGRLQRFAFWRLTRSPKLVKIVTISEALKTEFQPWVDSTVRILVAPSGSFKGPVTRGTSNLMKVTKPFTVGYAGAFYSGRGLDIIVQMARLLPTISFTICGGSLEEFKGAVNQFKIPSNVKVYGRLAPHLIPQFLEECDALLAPYQNQVGLSGAGDTAQIMSPLKIFEYMKAGRPIIASDLPALREVLEHNANALLCPPRELTRWIDAIVLLEANKEVGKQLSARAMKDFDNFHSSESRAELILSDVED